jgi:hypothetical protein
LKDAEICTIPMGMFFRSFFLKVFFFVPAAGLAICLFVVHCWLFVGCSLVV